MTRVFSCIRPLTRSQKCLSTISFCYFINTHAIVNGEMLGHGMLSMVASLWVPQGLGYLARSPLCRHRYSFSTTSQLCVCLQLLIFDQWNLAAFFEVPYIYIHHAHTHTHAMSLEISLCQWLICCMSLCLLNGIFCVCLVWHFRKS